MKKNSSRIVDNRKARHNYNILETYEAGISLSGTEVKSIRAGKVNLSDSYGRVKEGEAFLINMHISPYKEGNRYNLSPTRERKLLLHKKEIDKLYGKMKEKSLTLVPLNLHWKRNRVKVDVALCKAKKLYDKREDKKKKDVNREIQRAMQGRY